MIKMKRKKFILLIVSVVIATLFLASAAFFILSGAKGFVLVGKSDFDTMSEISERYAKLYAMQEMVNDQFLWETDEEEQMNAIYKALIDSLGDKYSVYMDKEEYANWNNYVNGTFTGVGITFAEDDEGNFVITDILNGGPADSAGLKEDDILLTVDGKSYDDSEEMASHLRGKEGTEVKVTYRRGSREREVSLVRAEVEQPSVYGSTIDGDYGYIRITAFEKSTAEQFRKELAGLENKNVKGLIVDLRDNPGGLMDQGIEVADMLLPECTITHTEDKNGKTEYYNSDESCTKLKYAVLINENTASASEIVAAAIKDNQGGPLIGTTTFGKGIIQGSMEFKDETALKLTIMQYLSPEGNQINGVGVKPDYKVKMSQDGKKDSQLRKALNLLKDG
ncbi:MAG: S41 family peptidase [Anaerovoracaceae bacterium]